MDSIANNPPLVSILINTFNRKELLKRCLGRVLAQSFTDFEVIVIDDCSSDGTDALMATYSDPRIRYFRNETNLGKAHGDRLHIKRFIHELSRGKYFIYVCDDDYWISSNLLARQIEAFKTYPNAVMVTGGQLSYFLAADEIAPDIDETNLPQYLEYIATIEQLEKKYGPIERVTDFFKDAFPKHFMTSDEFLQHFSAFPVTSNIIVGATLYDRERFIRSAALQSPTGSKWQAGYELFMGPGCYGDFVYINEPCILTEIRQTNASFNRTQREHYFDSIDSINYAFEKPLQDWRGSPRETFLKNIKERTIENLGRTFMSNTLVVRRHGALNMCTPENMRMLVTPSVIWHSRRASGAGFPLADIKTMLLLTMPLKLLNAWDFYRRLMPRVGFKIVMQHRMHKYLGPLVPRPVAYLWNRFRAYNPQGGNARPLMLRIKCAIYPFMPKKLLGAWYRAKALYVKRRSLMGSS